MRFRSLTLVLMLALTLYFGRLTSLAQEHHYIPPNGFVPDAKTAVRVAEAILVPIYGEQRIHSEEPFTATLSGDVWTVEGSLPNGSNAGGVALIEISKTDGRVRRVTHGK